MTMSEPGPAAPIDVNLSEASVEMLVERLYAAFVGPHEPYGVVHRLGMGRGVTSRDDMLAAEERRVDRLVDALRSVLAAVDRLPATGSAALPELAIFSAAWDLLKEMEANRRHGRRKAQRRAGNGQNAGG